MLCVQFHHVVQLSLSFVAEAGNAEEIPQLVKRHADPDGIELCVHEVVVPERCNMVHWKSRVRK